jgi:two-component system, chemotaxis family, protein-glutamate methylesterase/glutaminase
VNDKILKIMIVDDSVVVRSLLSRIINSVDNMEIFGTASNGQIALDKLKQGIPDLVILDIEMPILDGISTLVEIRKKYRQLPVIMFSTLTLDGANSTIDALAKGASDYLTKPTGVGNLMQGMTSIEQELIPKIKSLCKRGTRVASRSIPPRSRAVRVNLPPRSRNISSRKQKRIELVVIGISTGGPNALMELIPGLPENFPVPIVIVQHMPPVFTTMLAQRLDNFSKLRVFEAADGDYVKAGEIAVAPGNFHLFVKSDKGQVKLGLNQDEQVNSCRPAVDVLFDSAVSCFGESILGMVLTGMGKDGCTGAGKIKNAGGCVIIQDENSSVVWGMPGAVFDAGLADEVLALNELSASMIRRSMYGRLK